MNYTPESHKEVIGVVDTFKVKYIHKLIEATKKDNVKLFFTASPRYGADTDSSFVLLKDICKKNQIPFITFYTDSSFNSNKEFFKDRSHLNKTGAYEYTKTFIKVIKPIVKKDL